MKWYLLNKGDKFRLERLSTTGLVREREADWIAVGFWDWSPKRREVALAMERFRRAFIQKEENDSN